MLFKLGARHVEVVLHKVVVAIFADELALRKQCGRKWPMHQLVLYVAVGHGQAKTSSFLHQHSSLHQGLARALHQERHYKIRIMILLLHALRDLLHLGQMHVGRRAEHASKNAVAMDNGIRVIARGSVLEDSGNQGNHHQNGGDGDESNKNAFD